MNTLWIALLGFFITLYAVSIGRGGGLLYVGILTTVAGVEPQAAVATSLAILVPTTMVGSFSHWRLGNIKPGIGMPLLLSGILGAVAGSLSTHWISVAFYRRVIGIVLFWTLIKLVWVFYKRRQPEAIVRVAAPTTSRFARSKASGYGFLGGMLSGLTGMSGSAAVLAGLTSLECEPLEIVGTSLFALSGIAASGFLMHLNLGIINWTLAGELCLGSVLGSAVSPVLLSKVPKHFVDRTFEPIFVVLISWMTFRMLFF
jgi:uncharacterized membrane protein YfcA